MTKPHFSTHSLFCIHREQEFLSQHQIQRFKMKSHGLVDNVENCAENQRLLQDNQKPDGASSHGVDQLT
jgi:hypothetical protein